MKAEASELLFGHDVLAGAPIVELQKVRLRCGDGAVFKGAVNVNAEAVGYGGKVKLDIQDIPLISNGTSKVILSLSDVDLAKYPAGRLPWFKNMSGTLNGRIKKETSVFSKERQKGAFSVTITNGEIGEIITKGFVKLSIPFKTISAEGTIFGTRLEVTKISITSDGLVIKGGGYIEGGGPDRAIDLRLSYEGKSALLRGKGTITVSGSLWAPEITINQAG
jgi:hypothetical protein